MPIDHRLIVHQTVNATGNRLVHVLYVDHVGNEIPVTHHIGDGYSTEEFLDNYETSLNARLPVLEGRLIYRAVLRGKDPSSITAQHMTVLQALVFILHAWSKLEARAAIRIAKWLQSDVTPAQIEAAVGTSEKTKVIRRASRLIGMEADLNSDLDDRVIVNG